jgi:hypothetical protein
MKADVFKGYMNMTYIDEMKRLKLMCKIVICLERIRKKGFESLH